MSEFENRSNPYESPFGQSDASPTPGVSAQSGRPTSVTVFGILNIVFGTIGLCGLGFSALVLFASPAANIDLPPNPTLDAMRDNPAYFGFMVVSSIVGLVFAIVLIVAGILLLTGKQLGRKLSIAYAIYAIIGAIVGIFANIFFVFGPLLQQGAADPAVIGGIIGGVIGGVIGLIYPGLLWYYMRRPHVIAALR